MALWHMCSKLNQLPFAGGVFDQPWRIMFLFEIISGAESERDIRDREKQRRQQEGAGRARYR